MPSMFNKSLNTTGRHTKCREVIYDATLKNVQSSPCPHCGAASYAHGYRRRLVDFMNDEGAVRKCRLKVKRFRCRECHRTQILALPFEAPFGVSYLIVPECRI